MDQQTKTLVGFAIKSRQTIFGFDAVNRAVLKNKIELVLLHHSLSFNAMKKLSGRLDQKNIAHYTVSGDLDWNESWGLHRHKVFGIVKGDLGNTISKKINSGV